MGSSRQARPSQWLPISRPLGVRLPLAFIIERPARPGTWLKGYPAVVPLRPALIGYRFQRHQAIAALASSTGVGRRLCAYQLPDRTIARCQRQVPMALTEARPVGFEPTTFGFEVRDSIR